MKRDYLNKSVLYNVYPTSFYDSNGDGIGDIKGITEKLEYIKQFANIIWINPIFLSDFGDGGYDVIDYKKIDPRFGTIEDLKELFKKAKELDLKVLLDLVIGHTSHNHEWFKQSQKAERNKYSDYYVWTTAIFDECPYEVMRGNSERNGAYMTNFFWFQPSLNFGFAEKKYAWQFRYDDERLLPLHNEFLDIMRFYLDMGADGFRVDMAPSIVKDDPTRECTAKVWQKLFGQIRKEYPEVLFVSEWGQPAYSVGKAGYDIDFFTHCFSDGYNRLFRKEPWTNIYYDEGDSFFRKAGKGEAKTFFDYFYKNWNEAKKTGYVCVVSSNHDLPRIAYKRDEEELKVCYAFLLSLPCIPLIYYGDEIGMDYNPDVSKDGGYKRTGSRTPMQWTDGKNAGFSTTDGELYLPIGDKKINAEDQEKRPDSLMNAIKEILKVRKQTPQLCADDPMELISDTYPLIYTRGEKEKILIALNPSDREYTIDYQGEVLLSHNVEKCDKGFVLKAQSYIYIKL